MPGVPGKPQFDERGRVCRGCGDYKAWGLFYPNKGGLKGKTSRCAACDKSRGDARRDTEAGRTYHREASKLYRRRHPDKIAALNRSYRASHPDVDRQRLLHEPGRRTAMYFAKKRWRARKRGAPEVTLTCAEWEDLKQTRDHRCAYCFCKPKRLEQDHVLALSQGGSHTKQNVVPACRSCNASKGVKLLRDWLWETV